MVPRKILNNDKFAAYETIMCFKAKTYTSMYPHEFKAYFAESAINASTVIPTISKNEAQRISLGDKH